MPLQGAAVQALACVAVSAGFIAFGYDQSIANAVLASPNWATTFPSLVGPDNANALGAVLGAFVLGAAVGCLGISTLSHAFGRKPLLICGTVVTLLGTGLQAGSVNLGMWVVARIINGIGVGMVTGIAPTYIGELSSPHIRGRLMSMELVLGSLGLMTGFCMAYAYSGNTTSRGWREPLAWQGIPIIVTLACTFFMPESPRYLAEKDRNEEAEAVLVRLRGAARGAEELLEIREAIALERAATTKSWSSLVRKDDQCLRYRFMLNVGVNILQQTTGINMATYYAGVIIGSLNFTPYHANVLIICLGLAGHLGAVTGCLVLVDRFGRRWLLMGGSIGLAIGQAFLAGGIAHVETSTGAGIAAFGLFLYITVFSGTWLPGGWLYGPEITPVSIRSKSSGIGYAMQFLFNFFIVEITPYAINAITYKFYIIFAIVNALTVPCVWCFFPETANLSLEEVDCLFVGGKAYVRKDPNEPVSHAALDSALGAKAGYRGEDEEKATYGHTVSTL